MSKDPQTFLDEGTRFEGRILVTGTVRLDGYFKGDGQARGTLIIGEPGVAEGDLEVDTIVVFGRVTGTIRATDRVEIGATGRVQGVVTTPRLKVHDGAIMNGELHMSDALPKASEATDSAPRDASPPAGSSDS